MSFFRRIGALVLASLVGSSCMDADQEDYSSEPLDKYRAELVTPNSDIINGIIINGPTSNGIIINGIIINGVTANGIIINGIIINGIIINGIIINGIIINGIIINGTDLGGLSLNGSQLSIKLPNSNKVLTGPALKGLSAKFTMPAQSGSPAQTYTLRIDDVIQDKTSRATDVWFYQVSAKADNSNTWQSLCKDYSGAPSPLTLVPGATWDGVTGARIDNPKAVTPACAEGAIGKCVSLGYRPWASGTECTGSGWNKKCSTVSLKDHHQACTRMIRADYCGDGTPHTVNGTILDIYDYLTPPVQLQEENWKIESRWEPEGALCVSQRRHPEIAFPGCLRVTTKGKPATLVQLPACQAYATGDDRGLVVSTFNASK